MKTRLFIGLILFALTLAVTGAVFAEDGFTFALTEAYSYSEKADNWSIEISVPQISGMASEVEQDELNAHFFECKDEMIAEYKQNVEFAKQSIAEGGEPHFGYQYSWDVITDSDDYFVFRTVWFLAAGSSTSLNEYWNLDKKTGKLLDFDEDAVTSLEQMASIREQIFAKMQEVNESGEGMFWTEDDSLDISLGQVRYLNHWYYNQDGDLVITFDKYEIAPGAMGSPEFVISAEPAAAE
ncbi:MAG: DUF3298 domain-containing protein [Flexilinea sp.]|nr:DUF3298 domain-containing protein [Flexilinea sp.]